MMSTPLQSYVDWLQSQADGEPWGALIRRRGKIVCEIYGSGAGADSRWEIGSIRKAVAGTLLGRVLAAGKLSLDTAVYYKARPATRVDEWIGRIMAGLQAQ